jgi:hypothetical protein
VSAYQCPEKCWGAADYTEDRQEGSGGSVAGQRRADAEAFRGVVQAEPDDEHEGERDITGSGGVSGRQSVGEIVQSNPGGDHYRKLARTGNPRWCGGTVIDRGSTGPVEDSIGLVVAGAVEPDQAE